MKGLNAVAFDMVGDSGTISAADFQFKYGNTNTPATWATAPAPTSVTVYPGAGVNGSDRVQILWSDSAIANKWLQVVVNANNRT